MLIVIGLTIMVLGLLAHFGALSWLGHLPGDIRIEGEHSRVYIPITTMLLVSVVLTLWAMLLRRFF